MRGTRKVHAVWVTAAMLVGAWTVRAPLRAQQAPAKPAPAAAAKPAAEKPAAKPAAEKPAAQPAAEKSAAKPAADKPAGEQAEKFAATTINLKPGAGEKLTIHVLHWSTDADRAKLVAAFKEKGADELQTALGAASTLGYIWTSESLGYSLRYAQKIPAADGGERVLVATDRRLGVWTRGNIWKALTANAPDYPFTLVELHIAKRGTAGVSGGKTSLGAKVIVDEEAKALVLENYATAPLNLSQVKREDAGARSSN